MSPNHAEPIHLPLKRARHDDLGSRRAIIKPDGMIVAWDAQQESETS